MSIDHANILQWAKKLIVRANRGEAVSKDSLKQARQLIAAHESNK